MEQMTMWSRNSFKTLFPYLIRADGEAGYLLLNRYYRPLGIDGDGREELLGCVFLPSHVQGITPEIERQLAWNGRLLGSDIHLYCEQVSPVNGGDLFYAYMDKLKLLLDLASGYRGESLGTTYTPEVLLSKVDIPINSVIRSP